MGILSRSMSAVMESTYWGPAMNIGLDKFKNLRGTYNAYVIEVLPPDNLSDEMTRRLSTNREEIGEILGGDNVYVNVRDRNEIEELFERQEVDTDQVGYSMPWLFILDKHPSDIDTTDFFLIIELGELENSKDMMNVIRMVGEHINDDDFMMKLNWKQKERKLKKSLPEIAGLTLSVAGLA